MSKGALSFHSMPGDDRAGAARGHREPRTARRRTAGSGSHAWGGRGKVPEKVVFHLALRRTCSPTAKERKDTWRKRPSLGKEKPRGLEFRLCEGR